MNDHRAENAQTPSADRHAVEQMLTRIWCEVLARPHIEPDDDFFVMGGHSLLVLRISARFVACTGVRLPLQALFRCRTIAKLAEYCLQNEDLRAPTLSAAKAMTGSA